MRTCKGTGSDCVCKGNDARVCKGSDVHVCMGSDCVQEKDVTRLLDTVYALLTTDI